MLKHTEGNLCLLYNGLLNHYISCRDFHLILHGKCKSIYLKCITAKSSFLVILYLLSALVKDLLPAVTQLVPQTNFLSFCVILCKNWQ